MRNLITHQFHLQSLLKSGRLLNYYLDEFSKVLVTIDSELNITLFSFEDPFSNFTITNSFPLEEILSSDSAGQNLFLHLMNTSEESSPSPFKSLIYKSEDETLHLILSTGELISIDIQRLQCKLRVLTKSEIVSVEVSPNCENILIVSSDYKIALLNWDFQIKINFSDLDDGDMTKIGDEKLKSAAASFRGDSAFFCVLYEINGGRKCLIRDLNFVVFKSAARADNKVVFSVSEAQVEGMSNVVAWQPSGSLIAFFHEGQEVKDDSDTKISKSEKAMVHFSEKNGLRHGEFNFHACEDKNNYINSENPSKNIFKTVARKIKWNKDLPLLAIYSEQINLNNNCNNSDNLNTTDRNLRIYLRSNYEWSLKFIYDFSEPVEDIKFSDSESLRLFVILKSGKILTFDFLLDYFSLTHPNGTVAVVNGTKLKLTPLGKAVIPPPLCHTSLTIPVKSLLAHYRNLIFVLSKEKIEQIDVNDYTMKTIYTFENNFEIQLAKSFIFNANDRKGCFVVNSAIEGDDLNDSLLVINCEVESEINKINKYRNVFINKVESPEERIIIKRANGMFTNFNSENKMEETSESKTEDQEVENEDNKDDLFFNLVGMKNSNANNLNTLNFSNNFNSLNDNLNNLNTNSKMTNSNSFNNTIYLFHSDKSFSKMTIGETNKFSEMETSSQFEVTKSAIVDDAVIYLTKNNRLFLNNNQLATDITSFALINNFLLFTQTSNSPYNLLHIHEVSKLLSNSLNKINNNISADFTSKSFNLRTVERGALLVSISKINVTLQMPRGNLETIYPRLIVLNYIKNLIDNFTNSSNSYKEAFELVRKHKINTNFLYDVNPEIFLSNTENFISSVNSSDYLNLFINNLENSLCEEKIQIDPDSNSKEDYKKLYINNKINKICDDFNSVFAKLNNVNYLTTRLHCLIKKSPPEYFQALKTVQGQQDKQLKEKALEYLCWVVNADTLYDFALKTYDFEIVILVAKYTQKDPKEYLPYLKSLQSEEDEVMMKYRINADLKDWKEALRELARGKYVYFDLCLDIIKKHNLFEFAFGLFEKEDDLYLRIVEVYGDYLKGAGRSVEAAWAYFVASDGKRSDEVRKSLIEMFMRNGDVIEVFSIINEIEAGISFKGNTDGINCGNETDNNTSNIINNTSINNTSINTDNSSTNINTITTNTIISSTSEISTNKFTFLKSINVFNLLTEMIDICTASKKPEQLEKIFLYTFNSDLLNSNEGESHLAHSINLLRLKVIEGFLRLKKWQSAYLTCVTAEKFPSSSIDFRANFLEAVTLASNLQVNELKKNLLIFNEKSTRLVKVQHLKRTQPHLFQVMPEEMGDNVSDSGSVVSTSSKRSGMSKRSKSSKMSQKTKTTLSKRNIKEGSPVEEEYLINLIAELALQEKDVEEIKELGKVLNFCKLAQLAHALSTTLEEYLNTIPRDMMLSVAQIDFLNAHPEVKELFPVLNMNTKWEKERTGKFKVFKTVSG